MGQPGERADRTVNLGAPPKLSGLLAEFRSLRDASERADLLVEYAERFREVPPHVARRPFPEQSRVPGCESEAYVFVDRAADGTLAFHFAVENPQGISAKALAAVLDECLAGATAEQITALDDDMVYALFGAHLSMGKDLGLRNMIRAVRVLAQGVS